MLRSFVVVMVGFGRFLWGLLVCSQAFFWVLVFFFFLCSVSSLLVDFVDAF